MFTFYREGDGQSKTARKNKKNEEDMIWLIRHFKNKLLVLACLMASVSLV